MAKVVPGAIIIGNEDVNVSGIEYHSALIKSGTAFVAIAGFEQDGNAYVDQAIENGAVAIVTEKEAQRSVPQLIVPDARAALADLAARFFDYQKQELKICGVTGTNGKTTTCFLIKKIFEARGKRVGLITSLVYDTGKDRIAASRTTPESLDIFRLLFTMKNNGCANAVIEISSHALILQRVRNLDVGVALFTNITRDHLDFHRDMDDYLAAKTRLLTMVDDKNKWAVINYDSREFRGLLGQAKCSYMTYSLADHKADVFLENFKLRPDGSHFTLRTPTGRREVSFNLPGRFNLYNALAASGAALASGIDIDTIVTGLEQVRTIPGRLERIDSNAPFSIFIDFAHTPDALRRTLETLREIGTGRVLTVFGCGGDRDRGKRPLMGEAAETLSDYAVLTADNPRSETTSRIFDDVRPGFKNKDKVEIIEDRREAIAHILSRARENDLILLAGKGDENYQEIGCVRHPWSDREVAKEELVKLGFGN